MATIQCKTSRGHKYWYIVESRRVNGKPRPIVLEYLGKAEDLLRRLQGIGSNFRLKSYAHGNVAALLSIAKKLDVVEEINRNVCSPRPYFKSKPIRNNLTVGMTLLLAAVGRVCMETSKRGWQSLAKTTSLEHLLRLNFSGVDSQHFWDQMDALPINAISKIEDALMQKVLQLYNVKTDTLLFDTTNFFTFISSTNDRCTIAQRGKNKQHRSDLRQIGLALVVNKIDLIPLFHFIYQGNYNDSTVFKSLLDRIKQRLTHLNLDPKEHSIVFDQGNNSKENLKLVKDTGLHYVGALSPVYNKSLAYEALDHMDQVAVLNHKEYSVYRSKKIVWDDERTIVAYISEKLKTGQIRGLLHELDSAEIQLQEHQKNFKNCKTPQYKIQNESEALQWVNNRLKGSIAKQAYKYSVAKDKNGGWDLSYSIDLQKVEQFQQQMGLRILMTNRHEWKTEEIIQAYHDQFHIESAFREMKNPLHLAARPQYHWTDQKLIVHHFICVLGFLLARLVHREAAKKAGYQENLDSLLNTLQNIRLAAVIENSTTPGPSKVVYRLENIDKEQEMLMKALGIETIHERKLEITGCSVYTK